MKRILLIAFIFLFVKVEAQNMVISFSSTNPDEKIDSVLVENLSQGKSVVLNGTTNLELTASAVTSVPFYGLSSQFKVYPNPVSDVCFLQFENNEAGNVAVGLYDLTGKQIIGQTLYLEQGVHEFQLTGLPSGISVIKIDGVGFNYTNKIISTGKESTGLNLKYAGESANKQNSNQFKSATTNILMQFNVGERLKYTLYSNGNITVLTDIPTQSKAIAATFYEAKDADGNSYATVQIGTQIWLAENLKTTKYNDGTAIPNITDNTAWINLVTPSYTWYESEGSLTYEIQEERKGSPGYCWYNNDITYKNPHGALYNWYAINTGKLAPIGWHVPTDAELTILDIYLDGALYMSGGQLKETGTTHWLSPNSKATNNSGFTAIPGGFRDILRGEFFGIEDHCGFWSSSDFNIDCGWSRYIYNNRLESTHHNVKAAGSSVRCVKD